jgi:RNA polymerase sigma factor (sigma-70 family)
VLSDEILVERFRNGDEAAFGLMVARHRGPLIRLARRMLGSTLSDPEDIVQEAFLRAFVALPRDQRPMALRSWLHCVVRNCVTDEHRRSRAASLDHDVISCDETMRSVETRGEMALLLAGLQRLPARQREALVLSVLRDEPYAAVAAELGLSVSAVKALIFRARCGLRADAGLDTQRAA